MFVVVVQTETRWEDKLGNYEHVSALLAGVTVRAGSLIVLPEMFAAGFSMDVAAIAEEAGGATERFVASLAQAHHSTVVAGVVTRGEDGRGLNQAFVAGPDGEELARYTKLHPFSFAGEHEHYAAGEDVVVFPWSGLTVAPLICYDLRFPEAYRQAARRGAGMLVTIANFPVQRESHWIALNIARAIENQAYVVACNRCGADPKLRYGGRSMVIDPWGQVLTDAGAEPGCITAEIDAAALNSYRRDFPALTDLRDDLLGDALGAASDARD